MKETKGFIYIMTNPSFPDFVKIGYADDVERRLAESNSTTYTPFAFRIYATYAVEERLGDTRVHKIIDKLNPNLRAREYINGKERKREFYEMTKEDAYEILEAIAEINGHDNRIRVWEPTEKEAEEQQEAEDVEDRKRERLAPFSFDKCNIGAGEQIVFSLRGNVNSGTVCTVADNKKVEYDGRLWSLSELAGYLSGRSSVAGPRYFKYQGRWLNEIRGEIEGWVPKGRPRVSDSWIIPANPSVYDVEAAFEKLDSLEWTQSTNVQPGDTVFVYIADPVKALRYKCVAEETELYGSPEIDDSEFFKAGAGPDSGRHMRIRLQEDFGRDRYPLETLRKHGVKSVQSPQRTPAEFEDFLKEETV